MRKSVHSSKTQTKGGLVPLRKALTAPIQKGRATSLLFERNALEVRFYSPRGHDPQEPHDRDEVYVIAHGTGEFLYDAERVSFQPGDLLFVAAGVEHRFVNFSDDFATWVLFFGPEGGESPVNGGLRLVPGRE